MSSVEIRRVAAQDLPDLVDTLTDILHACVQAGASIGFVLPFGPDEARQFWTHRVLPAVRAGDTQLFVAADQGRAVGTILLGLDLPPNQLHRADVAKLLVHPNIRRRGIARRLLRELETQARRLGKTLLVLDTRTGDPSQALYTSEGFRKAGEIPGYCLNPVTLKAEGTTYMFKALT